MQEFPTIPELVEGTGPFTWYLMGFRAAEKKALDESNEAAEMRQ